MSEVAFTADLHYGFQDRLADIDWSCRSIINYCCDHDIDTIVNLGDLTHDRRSVSLDVYCTLYETLKYSRERGVNWYTFLGNHDMYLKHSWEVNSVKPISSVIHLINDVKVLVLDNRRFWILPFIHFEKSYMRVLAKIEEQAEPDDYLLTHIGVRGATLNTCFLLKDWSFVNFENTKFKRIYTGHFHNYQMVGEKVIYPGSPIPFKFDEGGVPHGFLVYNTVTDTHKFVDLFQLGHQTQQLVPPQFLTILDDQLAGLDETDVQHNALRIVLNRDYSIDEKLQIKLRLKEMGAKTVRWLQINKDTQLIQHGANGKVGTPAELFTRWIDADKPKGLDKQLLVRLELEVRHEGDERYSYDTDAE